MRLVIGVDRLNPCRGLPQKLLAFENLLTKYAQWRGKAIFVLVVREPWGGNWSQFGELRAEVRFFYYLIYYDYIPHYYCAIKYYPICSSASNIRRSTR